MTAAAGTCLAAALVGLAGCSVQETPAPPMTGPSELAWRVSMQAIPDSIFRDGASQAAIQIEATGPDGRPIRALPLRLEIVFEGAIVDFGLLSAKTVVTGDDGRARAVYTAPPKPGEPVDTETVVTIRATPIGTDYGSHTGRTVDLRLVTPGIILPPNQPPQPSFSITPTTPQVLTNVVFDASASSDEGQPCGGACSYSWDFGDGSKGSGQFTTHQYSAPGPFQVRLTVTDSRGASGVTAQTITIGQGAASRAALGHAGGDGRLRLGVPQRPTDFDALLAALGAADAEPPPLMKQLLAGVNQGGRDDDPDQRALTELETWLDALIDERSSRFQS